MWELHRVGAPLRGVRGRTEVMGFDDLPGSSLIALRTDATQSRPYLLLKTKLSVHAFRRRGIAGEDGTDEKIAMLGARAVFAQGFDVFGRAVTFMRGETVLRKARVHFDEHAVAFDLRDDGGQGDGEALTVAAFHRFVRPGERTEG